MSDRPFRFTTDGELYDELNAYAPPVEPRRRGENGALAVCIMALLIGGVGAVRSVQERAAVPAAQNTATEAPAAP